MQRLAIFVNDAPAAAPLIEALLAERAQDVGTIVLCPPRMMHRVGRWTSNDQRRRWRRSWALQLREELERLLPAGVTRLLEWKTAEAGAAEAGRRLRQSFGTELRLVDLRLSPLGASVEPLDSTSAAAAEGRRWQLPVAAGSSLSVVLTLVD